MGTYALTLYSRATSCWVSTFTLAKTIRPGEDSEVASWSNMGAMALQGPHPGKVY